MAGKQATTQTTIEALLQKSKRDALPLAHLFVQARTPEGRGCPGALARFVSQHHERALRQYLLAHAVASGNQRGEWDATYPSQVWARALALDETRSSSINSVSRNWAWLEEAKLIRRAREKRKVKAIILYDDGSGDPYQHPNDREDKYLQLPYAFWRQGWDRRLDLAAIAALLILRCEKPGFVQLTASRVPEWYGISTTTFEKGIRILERENLLERKREQVEAPLSAIGHTFVSKYRLLDVFERKADEAKQ